MAQPAYAELGVFSNFSFLEGASHPDELAITAQALGLSAIGIADRNSLAGVVRAHVAAKDAGIQLLVGARLCFDSHHPDLLCYPHDRAAYGRLSELLSLGLGRAEKGDCRIIIQDLLGFSEGQELIICAPDHLTPAFARSCRDLAQRFQGHHLSLAMNRLYGGDDKARLAWLDRLGRDLRLPRVATNSVLAHSTARKALGDILVCIREHCTIDEAGFRLSANLERALKTPEEMHRLFEGYEPALAKTLDIADRCRFSLDDLVYTYPVDTVPDDRSAQAELERLTWEALPDRYPDGAPEKVLQQIRHELSLIQVMDYAPYFLTVHDIVRFARDRGILCQGRGSAANSAVCYVLGITAVDPGRIDLLFERFVSEQRDEPPDIDVDFEHERREEVLQFIYDRYGRDRAAMTATVISYRTKSAIRETAKALGLDDVSIKALQRLHWRRGWDEVTEDHWAEHGLDPEAPRLKLCLKLAAELLGFPRHLSQHTGGMVITRGPLTQIVPVGNAAMEARTQIQWDKNDLDALGILKVDILGLGMLSCIRKAFAMIKQTHGRDLNLATVPAEDPAVYDMLSRADSVGVFQVESRAQMSMLPRLRPRCFYDLVIEVAIVRPGPIQGDMVHPYLRRRNGEEPVSYPSEELRSVLEKTNGVPLFQEQAMKIAIVAAGFTPEEADGLRRAMATFRRFGEINRYQAQFIKGMVSRGYTQDFAERCFKQIEGFSDYGFPESHAASFALLVYVSSWIKCHYPATFAASLLNSQPMGFYAPAQIVKDAKDHGVQVRPVSAQQSDWDNTLEPTDQPHAPALRLGLRQVKSFNARDGALLTAGRNEDFESIAAIKRRTGISQAGLEALARADAFEGLDAGRRQAFWAVKALSDKPLPLFAGLDAEDQAVSLPHMAKSEAVADDYRALRLSLRGHPLDFFRDRLSDRGFITSSRLSSIKQDSRISVAGLAITRQRPGTSRGVVFITLEDESGVANIIVWPQVFEQCREAVLVGQLLGVSGKLQRESDVIHVIADSVFDFTPWLVELDQGIDGDSALDIRSRDFH